VTLAVDLPTSCRVTSRNSSTFYLKISFSTVTLRVVSSAASQESESRFNDTYRHEAWNRFSRSVSYGVESFVFAVFRIMCRNVSSCVAQRRCGTILSYGVPKFVTSLLGILSRRRKYLLRRWLSSCQRRVVRRNLSWRRLARNIMSSRISSSLYLVS
jgi:hypothetical protein